MNTSQELSSLYNALINFNMKIEKIGKTSVNPYFKSNYAPLDYIIDICRPVLCECGLCIIQMVSGNNMITTRLCHESGEFIEETIVCDPVPMAGSNMVTPQAVGSNITYMRRYAYQAILCLSIGANDDDANVASGNKPGKNKRKLDSSYLNDKKWELLSEWLDNNYTTTMTITPSTLLMDHYEINKDLANKIDDKYFNK